MAYVEAHAALAAHPKTKRLARLLGISRPQAVGHMLFLWWWCQDYAQDGNLSTFAAEDIAEAAGWEGDGKQFTESAITAGFLEVQEDGALLIHDWFDYGGKLFKTRAQGAKRQAEWRARHDNAPVTQSNTTETDSDALVTRHVTDSNAYRVDKIRVDKRRGEVAATPPPPLPIQAQKFLDNGGSFPSGKLSDGTTKKERAIQFIVEHVTPDPASLALWGRVVAGYCAQWSSKSYTIMVNDYYDKGFAPGEKRNGNHATTGEFGIAGRPKSYADLEYERANAPDAPGDDPNDPAF